MDTRIAILAASIFGAMFSFSFTALQCAALVIFPLVASLKRRNAVVAVTTFYTVAAIPSIVVSFAYTESLLLSLLVFVALIIINAAPLSFALYQKFTPLNIAIPLALISISIPPLAQVNPLTLAPLAGWLFPGLGGPGVVLLLITISLSILSIRLGVLGIVGLFALLLPYGVLQAVPLDHFNNNNVSTVSLSRAYDRNINTNIIRKAYRHEELELINAEQSDVVVLPESIFEVWQPSDGVVLEGSEKSIYGGARVYTNDTQYKNVVVNAKTGEVVYEQVNPPRFINNRYAQALAGDGELIDTGIAWLVCYEITNSWLIHQRMSNKHQDIVWLSNISWIKTKYFEKRLNSLQKAWSRLYAREIQTAMMFHD